MNRERLTILRDHLVLVPDDQFDMADWDCGTAACIGGWCERLWPEKGTATDVLGLTGEQANGLFYMLNTPMAMKYAKKPVAIAAIQSMLDNPADDALPVWPEPAQ